MPFTIVRQDITKMKVDAIVNPANTTLQMGGGLCGVIFKAAGADDLQNACNKLAPIQTGDAVITPGFGLPAKFVIHTAGPVYHDGKQGEEGLLRSSYLNSLKLAMDNQCQSIAFPLISSGIYDYPKEEALGVATAAIKDFLSQQDIDIYLAVFDKITFVLSKKLHGEVASYINEHYVNENYYVIQRSLLDIKRGTIDGEVRTRQMAYIEETVAAAPLRLEDYAGVLEEKFSAMLLRLINKSGKSNAEIYKRANIDRRLFSKIRSNEDYMPSKLTAIALAVALELTLDETDDLLGRAGYALSNSQKSDVIVQYFIVNKKYDIFQINEALFEYNQPLLGG